MFIEDYIVFRVNALLHAHDAKIVMRLEGGMSNYTYVVECEGKKYTYRVPGKFADKFVDREEEWANIQRRRCSCSCRLLSASRFWRCGHGAGR